MNAYIALQCGLLIALLVALGRGTRPLLWMVAFLAPLQGLSMFVGVALNWPKLTALLLGMNLLLGRPRSRFSGMPGSVVGVLCILYVVVISLWIETFDHEAHRMVDVARVLGWGTGQTTLRYVIQAAVFCQMFLSAFMVMVLVTSPEDMDAVLRGFVTGNLFSIVVGFYQAVANTTGLPWFDMEVSELVQGGLGLRERHQTFSMGGGFEIARLYGFGGEPKHSAAFAVLALAMVLANALAADKTRFPRGSTSILLLGIALTFSTAGWFSCVVVVSILMVLAARRGEVKFARQLAAVGLVAGIALGVVGDGERDAIIEARVASRMTGIDSLRKNEPKDASLIEHLFDHPDRAVFGHGAGGADFFLIPYVPHTMLKENSTLTPTYTATRLVGDVGLVGALLVFGVIWVWYGSAKKSNSLGSLFVIMAGSVVAIMPFTALPSYLLLTAAMAARGRLSSSERATDAEVASQPTLAAA